MKIGIVGNGVVGGAVARYFLKRGHDVLIYDSNYKRCLKEFPDLMEAPICFVSVPTLTSPDGKQDLGPLYDVMHRFNQHRYDGVIAHKCTVLPGTTKALQSQFPGLRLVHFPEFLTEKWATEDFENAPAVLLSGVPRNVAEISAIIDFKHAKHYSLEFATTEIAKYAHNCFLAVKLSFFNEIFEVCKLAKVNYDEMMIGALSMGKIGSNHTAVPGLDDKRGWGGMCFPKDTKALFNAMAARGLWMETLGGAMKTNMIVRGHE